MGKLGYLPLSMVGLTELMVDVERIDAESISLALANEGYGRSTGVRGMLIWLSRDKAGLEVGGDIWSIRLSDPLVVRR